MRYFEQAYEAERLDIDMAMISYYASCQRLLSPLTISHEEKEQLVRHPTSAKWKEPQLNAELKRRLGPLYDTYVRATQRLHKKLEKLKKRLEFDNDYLVRYSTISIVAICIANS